MQTFDVYLKKRLTEIDVIISQLVQRDTFTLYNYLYLLCSMSELELLKTITGETSMELDARILYLEERVHEYMNSEMYLSAMADFSSQVTTGGSTEMVLSVDEVNAIMKDLISGESVLEISVAPLDYYIAHSFGKVDFDMMLVADQLEFLKEGFENFDSEMYLFAESEFASSKIAKLNGLDMMLYTDPVGLFYLASVSGQAEMYLSANPIDEYLLEKVLYDLEVMTYLSSSIDSILHLEKFTSSENILHVFAKMTEVLIGIIYPLENTMILSCEASTGMKRYRFVSEMDDFTVSEFDNMTLHELDFITIA